MHIRRQGGYRLPDAISVVAESEVVTIVQRIIYASQAAFDLSPDELVQLLETSRANNAEAGLTGMLLYSSQSFLQLLEGPADVLAETYARIASDDRHQELRLLTKSGVESPMFPDWTMGFEHLEDEELAETVPGFTAASHYPLVNPDLVTNAGVAETLLRLYGKNRMR